MPPRPRAGPGAERAFRAGRMLLLWTREINAAHADYIAAGAEVIINKSSAIGRRVQQQPGSEPK